MSIKSNPASRLYLLLLSVTALTFFSVSSFAQSQGESSDILRIQRVGNPFLVADGIASALVDGKTLYVIGNQTGLQPFHSDDPFGVGFEPTGPSIVIGLSTIGMAKKGKYLFVSDNVNGIAVVDVSDSSKVKLVGIFPTISKQAEDLVLDPTGNFLFVATGKNGVEVWDVSKPEKPVRVHDTQRMTAWSYAWGVTYSDNKLIVADRENGVRIIDASNPRNLKLLATYKGTGDCRSAVWRDNILYLANGPAGFEVVDMKNLARPNRIFSENFTPNYVQSVSFYALNPNYLFVAAGKAGIAIYDVRLFSSAPRRAKERVEKGIGDITRFVQNGHVLYAESIDKGFSTYYVNLNPSLEKIPDLKIDENSELSYTFKGKDLDGNKFKIELLYEKGRYPDLLSYDESTATLKWKPSFEQSGVYRFTAKLTELFPDSLFGSSLDKPLTPTTLTQDFTITVNHINRPPSLLAIADQILTEGKPFTFTLIAGSDPDAEDIGKLKYRAENLPSGAEFDPETRVLTWTPNFAQSGEHRIRFFVMDSNSDGKGAKEDSKELRVRVENVNRAPSLTRMEKQLLSENTPFTIDILATDADSEDEGKLTYKSLSLPKGASFDPLTHRLSWTPTFEQAGDYTARFQVFDQGLDARLTPQPKGQLTDTMTVFISVKQTNRPPVLATIGAKTVKENALLTFTLSATDPDREDAGKLTFTAEGLPEGAQFDPLRRVFSWTPTFEQSGVYQIQFNVTDSGIDGTPLRSQETVTVTVINVNRPPTLDAITDVSGIENSEITFSVSAKDPDKEDVGKLTISANGIPNGASFNGSEFKWMPTFEQSGTYRLTYTVTDSEGMKDTKTQVIVVANLNRKPVFSAVPPVKGRETERVSLTVDASDEDKEDAGKLTFRAISLPQGATFDPVRRLLQWTPSFEQAGAYTLTFVVSDRGLDARLQPSSSQVLNDTLMVEVTITQRNRAPVLSKIGPKRISENSELKFELKPSDPDPEDQGKLVTSATGLPEGAEYDEKTLTFSWKPDYTQAGTYSVTFTVNDSGNDDVILTASETIVITVDNVNRAPELVALSPVSGKENAEVRFPVTAKDPDSEDDGKLKITARGLPQAATFDGKELKWTPSFDQAGSYRVLFTVEDQGLNESLKAQPNRVMRDTLSVVLTIDQRNRPPVMAAIAAVKVKENAAVTVVVNATDPDKEDAGKLAFSATGLPEGATFKPESRTFSWTPTFEQSGSYSVSITVTDAGIDGTPLTDTKTLSITVENVNRPPVISPLDNVTGKENAAVTVSFTFSDPDKEDEGKLNVTVAPLPQGATVSGNTMSWTPSFDQSGLYKLVATVTDASGAKATTPFTLTIENVNRPPKLNPVASQVVKERDRIVIKLEAVDPDKEDAPGKGSDKLVFSVDNLPRGAAFDPIRRTLQWQPDFEQRGAYTFTAKVKDTFGATDETPISITVERLNRKPTLQKPKDVTLKAGTASAPGESMEITLSASDPDKEDKLTFNASGLPPGSALSENGTLSIAPLTAAGRFTVEVTVTDNQGGEDKKTFLITVTPPPTGKK